jgi:putative pyoverdin transport system ATP-binding/permease protein
MKVIPYLFRTSRREVLVVAGTALLGGAASAALVAIVNASLHQQAGMALLVLAFVAVFAVKLFCGVMATRLLVRLAQESVVRLSTRISRQVTATSFRRIEEIGSARIAASLTDDVNVLANAIQNIPTLVVNVAILIGCGVYLAWLSPIAAVTMAVVIAIAAGLYSIFMTRAQAAIRQARATRDTLFRHFATLTWGIKELKLNRTRREAFLREDVGSTVATMRDQNVTAMNLHATADAYTQVIFYGVLGLLLFVLPTLEGLSVQSVTAYVFTALYIGQPIAGLIAGVPAFARGEAAFERLNDLGLALDSPEDAAASSPLASVPPRIQFTDVSFTYRDHSSDRAFQLGPLNLELAPGEMVFVIGGNGSGKSTFVKLLTGLYSPDAGEVLVDGRPIAADQRQAYRENFSAVYSDFFLFDRLIGAEHGSLAADAQHYLEVLDLAHKVKIEDGRFSTVALSQGQRRRLALLSAYVEDRPVYVLDEWAADQDPAFRNVFYTELLPALKRRGKTVVVVTHDDRYFRMGDRVIKLEYGKLVDWAPAGEQGRWPARVQSIRPARP